MKKDKKNNDYIDNLQNSLIFEENLNKDLTQKLTVIQDELDKLKTYTDNLEKNNFVFLNSGSFIDEENKQVIIDLKSQLDHSTFINDTLSKEIGNLKTDLENKVSQFKNQNRIYAEELFLLQKENDKLKKIIFQEYDDDCKCYVCSIL